jgi:hypothetical protein
MLVVLISRATIRQRAADALCIESDSGCTAAMLARTVRRVTELPHFRSPRRSACAGLACRGRQTQWLTRLRNNSDRGSVYGTVHVLHGLRNAPGRKSLAYQSIDFPTEDKPICLESADRANPSPPPLFCEMVRRIHGVQRSKDSTFSTRRLAS